MRWLVGVLLIGSAQAQNCPPVDTSLAKKHEAECRAQGGEWSRYGVIAHLCNVYSCAPRTKDGGKACRSQADCEYQCFAEKPGSIGTEVKGVCAAVASPYGCNYPVEGGRITGRICVD